MVEGVKEYWEDKGTPIRSIKYIAVVIAFLFLVFASLIYMLLFHPVTNFEVEPVSINNSDFVTLTAVNDGGLKEEFIDINLNVSPISECKISSKEEGCEEMFNNKVFCNYLDPGEHLSVECPLHENGTVFKVVMRSKYQTSKLEFMCSPQRCNETLSHLHGSFPVLWNYLLAYPADRLIEFYDSFKIWLWGENQE
ncbi:MAG: hypothetical protein JSW41_04575 [Candidatus Aenigmatarchaeota archaeon]|nr:MAG: hypothetical protein JSW41_04575 [Candidatus Aenigmarchaeota archaeon]